MKSTFLPRLAIKVANYMKKIRDVQYEFNGTLVVFLCPLIAYIFHVLTWVLIILLQDTFIQPKL